MDARSVCVIVVSGPGPSATADVCIEGGLAYQLPPDNINLER